MADLSQIIQAAAQAALENGSQNRTEQGSDKVKRKGLSMPRALLVGAALFTAGRVLVRSNGRDLVESLQHRLEEFEPQAPGSEDEDGPEDEYDDEEEPEDEYDDEEEPEAESEDEQEPESAGEEEPEDEYDDEDEPEGEYDDEDEPEGEYEEEDEVDEESDERPRSASRSSR